MDVDRRRLLAAGATMAVAAITGAEHASAVTANPLGRHWRTSPAGLPVAPAQLFASNLFNDEALFALGAASSRTGEVGEVLRIAQEINAVTNDPENPDVSDFSAYVDGFGRFGDHLARMASQAGASHGVTKEQRNLRAAMYAAQQLFFVLGSNAGSREQSLFRIAQSRWLDAVNTWTPRVVHDHVPSRFGPIPVHFFPSGSGVGARPTVIISEGSDGQNVETMQFGVTAGLSRGYNVVLFEGPGQMSMLFERRIPFTANWNEVVGPVLAWTRSQPDVGKVGLIGISFGGMLCARAAARVRGLDAVVLEPAAYDFTTMWNDQESMSVVKDTVNAPAAEKAGARAGINAGFVQAWPSLPRTVQFTIYKRGSIFQRRAQSQARAGQPISDYYGLLEAMLPFRFGRDFEMIRIPALLLANEGDEFFDQQSAQAFTFLDSLPPSDKALVRLTAAQGASLHDQPAGPQVAEEIVFDWLDDRLT